MYRTLSTLVALSALSALVGCATEEEAALNMEAEEADALESGEHSAEVVLEDGTRGCNITLEISWDSSLPDTESIDCSAVKAKVKGGWYKSFNLSSLVVEDQGDEASDIVNADFSCGSRRRYEITCTAYGNDGSTSVESWEYPSSTTWTTSTFIDLGNVSARF
jgi:hypothetical protein